MEERVEESHSFPVSLPSHVQALANIRGKLKLLTSYGIGVTARSIAEESATKPCTSIQGTLRIINTYRMSRQLRMTVRQLFQNSLSRPPTSLIRSFDLRAVSA